MNRLVKKNVTKAEIKRIANYCKDEFKNYNQKEMIIVKTRWNTLETIRSDFKKGYIISHPTENIIVGSVYWSENPTVKTLSKKIREMLIDHQYPIFKAIINRVEEKLQQQGKHWDEGATVYINDVTEEERDQFLNNVDNYKSIAFWEVKEEDNGKYELIVSI